MTRGRSGVTLLELVVVLTILGVLTSIVALSLGGRSTPRDPRVAAFESARHRAASSGVAIVIADSTDWKVRFLPDGRVIREGSDGW